MAIFLTQSYFDLVCAVSFESDQKTEQIPGRVVQLVRVLSPYAKFAGLSPSLGTYKTQTMNT